MEFVCERNWSKFEFKHTQKKKKKKKKKVNF
jgi:hypothetical protein